ncbi:malonate decarboxylase holo-[acyl-carrier-protein] synthase [Pseudoduganella eburnea]|uniref:Malonate decarboxylase holo-[acyl-carrier-protein] synthase n=1 Tax=Massilia eburnea TaxID=1776165 RepID=A0A6L6QIS6_9BURK|nr:malonate decarboxylase holo-[acyl-carrier-protein] synthase [Massilia eburnea]MTW12091.1 malonate decarboxylase holo-[acyl-carrier-protein] synthase [Massilia eburnea]
MYARHDLVWLTDEGWQHALSAALPGTPAHTVIARWACARWPLVVRRRDTAGQPNADICAEAGAGAEVICLGLSAPPDPDSGAKLRLPLAIPARHIARHSAPLQLDAVAHAIPAAWQLPFARLSDASAGMDLRVFGSLALQALTGQPYLRESSDIDLLFRPRSTSELDAGTLLLASFLGELPLDGEIVFPSGQAVAWKEWFTARAHTERVLIKSKASVKLAPRAELRAELETA